MRDLYAEVTASICTHIEAVIAAGTKWNRPFVPGMSRTPVNVDGRPYRGINAFLLGMSHYESGCWATYKRWAARGAQVRKGERGTTVVFWKEMFGAKPKDGETTPDDSAPAARGKRWLMMKSYTVFAAEQVDGFDLAAWTVKHKRDGEVLDVHADRVEAIDAMFERFHSRTGVRIEFKARSSMAAYAPALDRIVMPRHSQFKATGGFYATWAHEQAHSTGHRTRLDRDLSVRFGSDAYAVEELIAEMTSAFVCAAVGVGSEMRQDHACYLVSWLKVLKADTRAIFTVMSKVQAAADFILEQYGVTVDADEPEQLEAA